MPTAPRVGFRWITDGVVRGLRGWSRQWISTERTLKVIGQYVAEVGKQSFDNQRSPEGGPWKKLSAKRAAWKAKKGYDPRALILTKQLKNSITYSIQPSGMRPAVFIGPTAHHGVHHQFGAPRAGIPARPFMGMGPQHEREVRRVVAQWLTGVKV
jgi:phage virion morphogenesis protein